MQVTWTKDLEIGIKHIDQQHESLFGLLNILYDSIEARVSHKILAEVVDELLGYCIMHFQSEQTYMEIKAYAERFTHQVEHESFKKQVANFRFRIQEGETGFAIELADFIHNWMLTHIRTVDIKLKEL